MAPSLTEAAAAISFDLDGVIMRGPWLSEVRPRIWAHLGRGSALAHLASEERERQIWLAVREEHDRRLEASDFVGAWNWQAIYSEVSRAFGGEPVPDLASLVRECCQVEAAVALLPGARQGLHRLADAGIRIVAITNGYHAYQWPVLEALGVADLFESVITPDLVGFAKPDPRIFQCVSGLAAHVGDLLVHDVMGANLAGLQPIWLDPDMPDALCGFSPSERVRAPDFATHLEATLTKSRYRRFHPEATPESCTPTAVVRDVDEAASVVLDSIAVWTSASR